MANYPKDLRYSKEHEWVKLEASGTALVGITFFAQEQLGDVVFVVLPKVGAHIKQFAKLGEVESVKAVSDVFSPISGEVIAVNDGLTKQPETLNADPYGKAWLIRVRPSNTSETHALLTADQYEAYLASGEAQKGH